jgi:hypothetical protein
LLSASGSPGRALSPIVEAARTVLDIQPVIITDAA